MLRIRQSGGVSALETFPRKPRSDGRFQKRIQGRLYYFGAGGDRPAALAEYDRVKRDLYAGRVPKVSIDADSISLKELANLFTAEQRARSDAGDITAHHLDSYERAIGRLLAFVGRARQVSDLGPDDFAAFGRHLRGKCKLGPFAFNRDRACIVAMFNHADECGWIRYPVRVGKGFAKASVSELRSIRKHRLFDPDHIHALIKASDEIIRPIILLGINAGFGATDCVGLMRKDVDLKKRQLVTIREKRHTLRMVPLWKETVEALTDDMGDPLVFHATQTEITKAFAALVDDLNIPRPNGVAFGALRHTFATIANECQDRDATRLIMGHKLAGLDDVYVERIEWSRLKRVTDHVRRRIIGTAGKSRSRAGKTS